jgi:anti-sigma factor RsiW
MAMIEKRYLELIHKEIDGENSPEERAALQGYLSANQSARELFEELQQLSGFFDQMEEAAPPEDLGKSILSDIQARQYRRTAEAFRSERAAVKMSAWKWAYAFAAGLILGALLAPLALQVWQGNSSQGFSQLLGTLSRKDVIQGAAVHGIVKGEGVDGTVQIKHSNTQLLIELELASRQPVEVVIQHDAKRLRFNGLEQSSDEALYFQSLPEQLTWTHQGHKRYRILMTCSNEGAPAIRIRVLLSGNPLYDGSFPLPTSP